MRCGSGGSNCADGVALLLESIMIQRERIADQLENLNSTIGLVEAVALDRQGETHYGSGTLRNIPQSPNAPQGL